MSLGLNEHIFGKLKDFQETSQRRDSTDCFP